MVIYFSENKFYLPKTRNGVVGKIITAQVCEKKFYNEFEERKLKFEALEASNKVVREKLNDKTLSEDIRKEYETQFANIIKEYTSLLNKRISPTKKYTIKMRITAFNGNKAELEPAYKKDLNLIEKLGLK